MFEFVNTGSCLSSDIFNNCISIAGESLITNALLLESGGYFLLESGGNIFLE